MATKRITTLALRTLCLLAITSCSNAGDDAAKNALNSPGGSQVSSEGKSRDAGAVRVSVSEATVKAGGSGEAVVRLNVADGFHVNANPASDKYLIATSVEAKPGEGLKVGVPAYPAGVTRQFGFSRTPLAVYEGEVSIRLPLSAEAGAAKGRRSLDASVTVQPCDEKECFQPRTINAAIPVVVE